MNNHIKISAIITSGGNSLRFGSNKLLEKLGEYSVIETTISKFIDLVDEIIIPAQDEVKNHILKSKFYCGKIKFAPSGSTRQKSVYEGILACNNPEIVLIHDGARPFINKEIIKKTIDMTYKN
ncbi:MAG: 2-C-methyl-D-erythritol 4-phosphate cytidylyltransferase, partial [Candidatus Gastranaerophilales bacterium]|nr:2-C-methyl-D-erythritol 4-phosphate cytidylyltransferase [Candidatus Gastranaerophilales bacterium]